MFLSTCGSKGFTDEREGDRQTDRDTYRERCGEDRHAAAEAKTDIAIK